MKQALHGRTKFSKGQKSLKRLAIAKDAMNLKIAGVSYEEIALRLGSSYQTVKRACEDALALTADENKEAAMVMLPLELERLDKMFMAHWNNRGVDSHAATLLRIMDRRARYLGLDAPEKAEISGPDGGPIQFEDKTEELLAKLHKTE